MSTCISTEGEYSEHSLGRPETESEYRCTRCGVLDEEACLLWLRRFRDVARENASWVSRLDGQVRGLKSEIATLTQERDALRTEVDKLSARIFEVTITYVATSERLVDPDWSQGKAATLFASNVSEATDRLASLIGTPSNPLGWAFRVESIREVRLA